MSDHDGIAEVLDETIEYMTDLSTHHSSDYHARQLEIATEWLIHLKHIKGSGQIRVASEARSDPAG